MLFDSIRAGPAGNADADTSQAEPSQENHLIDKLDPEVRPRRIKAPLEHAAPVPVHRHLQAQRSRTSTGAHIRHAARKVESSQAHAKVNKKKRAASTETSGKVDAHSHAHSHGHSHGHS